MTDRGVDRGSKIRGFASLPYTLEGRHVPSHSS